MIESKIAKDCTGESNCDTKKEDEQNKDSMLLGKRIMGENKKTSTSETSKYYLHLLFQIKKCAGHLKGQRRTMGVTGHLEILIYVEQMKKWFGPVRKSYVVKAVLDSNYTSK